MTGDRQPEPQDDTDPAPDPDPAGDLTKRGYADDIKAEFEIEIGVAVGRKWFRLRWRNRQTDNPFSDMSRLADDQTIAVITPSVVFATWVNAEPSDTIWAAALLAASLLGFYLANRRRG